MAWGVFCFLENIMDKAMNLFDDRFPPYTIGADAYDAIDAVCLPHGSSAVIIGGHKALGAAEADIRAGACKVNITGTLFYGGESSYENVSLLSERNEVRAADMIFAVGGGKALDTCKCLAVKLGKPVFTFPTIASNCAASTSVSIMYNPDGSFREPFFFEAPPVHVFIRTPVIACAPSRYLWAGMGDSLAKYLESEMSGRGESLPEYISAGISYARDAYETILACGKKALEENKSCESGEAFESVAAAVIITVGKASVLLCTDRVIDYNTGLAHAVFYAMTSYPHIEKDHLHGEVVAFGCLILALVDGNTEYGRLYDFARWCGLPTRITELEFTAEQTSELISKVLMMKDIEHNPYKITNEMLKTAFEKTEKNNLTS